ncbi:hypothetical protein [Isorropodon fossajaponicum symbiont]|nr:hypothetical protein [Isorropodon fossajaponicum symbiont]
MGLTILILGKKAGQEPCKMAGWETAYSGFKDGAFKQCFEKEILGR